LLWLGDQALPDNLAAACALAALDLGHAATQDDALAQVASWKPDIVLHDAALPDPACAIRAARGVASLPVLALANQGGKLHQPGRDSRVADVFLALRAALRRDRPVALKARRQAGPYCLEEAQFKFCLGADCVAISKTELAILGPFFDVADAIFDRQDLAQLAFGNEASQTRNLDAQISRLRRHIRAGCGVDPLRSVRGVGYALAMP
jgi:two-component system phosphate regulon response regulator PhoB